MAIYSAPLHVDEKSRIAALKNTMLLDSPSSSRFDDITLLTAQVFNVPIALVSLVDKNRQWFLSNCGLAANETHRDEAFCAHAIHEDEILVIEDASQHPTFKLNPLVLNEPNIRFYAGAVLRSIDGLPLGTLCIIDSKPRHFPIDEQNKLLRFAGLIRKELLADTSHNRDRTKKALINNKDPITHAFINGTLKNKVDSILQTSSHDNYWVLQISLSNINSLSKAYGNFIVDHLMFEVYGRTEEAFRDVGEIYVGRDQKDTLTAFFVSFSDISHESINATIKSLEHSLALPINTKVAAISPSLVVSVVNQKTSEGLFSDAIGLANTAIEEHAVTRDVEFLFVGDKTKNQIQRKTIIARDLHNAIENNALHLVYQPKITASENLIVGAECLLRWNHPKLGFVDPTDIVEVAQQTNCLLQLEKFIFYQALQQWTAWRKTIEAPLKLSINLTGSTLISNDFYCYVKQTISDCNIPRDALDIEILESSIFYDRTLALKAINALSDLRISFSLDDFGTGFSNLSYLKSLPITTLKIDKSFVDDISSCKKSKALCNSIIHMAKELNMECIAEGVETKCQLEQLVEMGCGLIQGYFFSKPLEPSDFLDFCERNCR
ncbi:EAL domain-containing protein [Alteromonas gracilis]|uniref:EAL domain-containing protein n=1 Tax=Alteromonas gracilis TaxID=1479524 RepID=UPI0037361111